MKYDEDTIAAVATPIGIGGISVIRVSGDQAIATVDRLFRGKIQLKDAKTQTAHYGYVVDQEENLIDEVVSTVYRSPHSYTAEDCVEISCHGGVLVTRKLLEIILESGARLAQPGEFTKRAFLNGRIDLSQAEAVADLIHSRSELSHKSSLQQLSGKLSQKINRVRDELIHVCSLIELELDFAEEDIELTRKSEVSDRISAILAEIGDLIESFKFGKVYREGAKVVISGKPNVGKSSLLNALLNENRAIVTDIPGTTRDVIEESLNIEGVLFRVVDTAGLREAEDLVEKEGVRRSEAEIESSDLILLVFDLTDPPDKNDLKLINGLRSRMPGFQDHCILVFNKLDLVGNGQDDRLAFLEIPPSQMSVKVSALTHEGLDVLKKQMVSGILSRDPGLMESDLVVTNVRHKEALVIARNKLELALESLQNGQSGEFVSLDLRAALDSLGEIVGAVTTEDILNNVFAKFCIGK